MGKRKRKESVENSISTNLSSGILLYSRLPVKGEDFYYLAIKGVMIFLLVFGNIGGFLSAFDMEYSEGVFAGTIFLGAVFFSLIYYSGVVRNIAYVVFFIVFITLSVKYRTYINSGFYAVVNEVILTITDYLDIKGANEYSEFYTNRYLTVTTTVCFLGLIDAMLMNITMLTRIRRFSNVLISSLVLLLPLYFAKEPDLLYVSSTMAGLGSMMVMKAGGHNKSILKLPQKEKGIFGKSINEKRRKKKQEYLLSYRHSWRVELQTILACVVITVVAVTGMQLVVPKENFQFKYEENSWKTVLDEKFKVAWNYGLEGLLNHQTAGGGIGKGDLSGGASVRPNYETDLILTVAPYTMNTIYLKAYTGVTYKDNKWQELQKPEESDEKNFIRSKIYGESLAKEAELLAMDYERKVSTKTAKAKIKVKNVGADEEFLYYPYYTQLEKTVTKEKNVGLMIGEENIYEYYPFFGNVFQGEPGIGVDEAYLHIPEENYQVIEQFCQEVNPKGTPLTQAAKIIWYFRANIPYTVRPGALPAGEDAVNYFLTENRKGYCSHFASAATLIFRYLGIPARYVEGYAVDAAEISAGQVLQETYEDYYDGYSELGETAVVQVEVTDASAHAWVEVYLKDFGWVPVEVTVSDSIDGEFYEGFGQWLGGFFATKNGETANIGIGDMETIEFIHIRTEPIHVVFVLCLVLMFGYFTAKTFYKFSFRFRKDEREKLIGEYGMLCDMVRILEADFNKCITHKEQWAVIGNRLKLGDEAEKMAEKLEEVSYGNKKYTKKEIEEIRGYLINAQKQILKKGTLKEKYKVTTYIISGKKIS